MGDKQGKKEKKEELISLARICWGNADIRTFEAPYYGHEEEEAKSMKYEKKNCGKWRRQYPF